MARVETVVVPEPKSESPLATGTVLMLRPSQIKRSDANRAARPGPPPPDEQKAIEGLARELARVGQIVPLIIDSYYNLIDGARRLSAAEFIESAGVEFPLSCIVLPRKGRSNFQDAIHANLKRRGLTALQFAYLCKEVRESHGWTGTAEVASYLGVSRAQVSQHDKLLLKPDAMHQEQYDALLAIVQAGRAGADTAFYTLTHVNWSSPAAKDVIDRAQELAEADEDAKEAVRTPKTPAARQKAGKSQQQASDSVAATAKETKVAKTLVKRAAKVEKKHVKQAAQESRAIKEPEQKTQPELRALFEKLRAPAFPDPMRNFISTLASAWWRGDATDKEVVAHWTQIALLVEESLDRVKPKHAAVKKAVA